MAKEVVEIPFNMDVPGWKEKHIMRMLDAGAEAQILMTGKLKMVGKPLKSAKDIEGGRILGIMDSEDKLCVVVYRKDRIDIVMMKGKVQQCLQKK